jgi:hypothetical protein
MCKFKWLSALIFFLLLSCGKALPELEGIDQKLWKDDRNGCSGKRFKMAAAVKGEKNKLLALDEMQIVKLLGNPDRNELFKRNQKFYYYFIEPSPDCKHDSTLHSLSLVVRFNAMGLAKETALE